MRGAEKVGRMLCVSLCECPEGLNTVGNTDASLSVRKLATELFGAFLKKHLVLSNLPGVPSVTLSRAHLKRQSTQLKNSLQTSSVGRDIRER